MAIGIAMIAFGPGERHFSGGISAGIVPVQSATPGRAVFGTFGVLCDVITLLAWWLVYRKPA